MAKIIERLTPLKITKAAKPGMYPDGGGLYLQVRGKSRSWLYRYTLNGKQRLMGLGSYPTFSLEEARARATAARQHRLDGRDPIEVRAAERSAARMDESKTTTFRECATQYIASRSVAWRNAKHAAQWTNSLETYAMPLLGELAAQAVDTALVLKVLEPIWTTKPETASRVRGRIEAILDWAKVKSFREGENPARWRGHMATLLPLPPNGR